MIFIVRDIWHLPYVRYQVMLVLWAALERGHVQVLLAFRSGTAEKSSTMRMRLQVAAALNVVSVTARTRCYGPHRTPVSHS